MNTTKIEWCDVTINPVVGCTFGCTYCYAAKLNKRFGWITEWKQPQFFPKRLEKLAKTKKSKIIFMNSMSDIADWENDTIEKVNQATKESNQHHYLFLTKRPQNITYTDFTNNVWIGTTITKQADIQNVTSLVEDVKAIQKFISIEPLHGEVLLKDEELIYIDWIIIGAETGNRKGKVIPKKEWIEEIVIQATKFNIPVFMKDSLVSIVGEEMMSREFPYDLKNNQTGMSGSWKYERLMNDLQNKEVITIDPKKDSNYGN